MRRVEESHIGIANRAKGMLLLQRWTWPLATVINSLLMVH